MTDWEPATVLQALAGGAFDDAATRAGARLAEDPDDAEAWFLLGTARHRQNRLDEATAAFRRACAAGPRDIRPRSALGTMLAAAGDTAAGLHEFQAALALAPDNPRLLINAAIALEALGQVHDALAHYDRAIATFPGMGDALQNRAALNLELGRVDAAWADAQRLVALFPDVTAVLELRATCALAQGRHHAALADYSAAVRLEPGRGEAWAGCAVALATVGRLDEAQAALQRGRAADADGVDRFAASARRATASTRTDGAFLDPRRIYLIAAWYQHQGADWRGFRMFRETFQTLVAAAAGTRQALVDRALLFAACHLPLARETRRQLTTDIARHVSANAVAEARPFVFPVSSRSRIRLGYLSADFREHPGSQALLPVLRHHDRERFEIHAYSLHDQSGAARDEVASLCDRFIDVSTLGDAAIAERIHADGIDILIDKTGYAEYGRAEVLAMRPAPLRVSYLGFPGSLGPGVVDYRISDRLASPPGTESEFSEHLIRLPHAHIVADRSIAIEPPPGGRAAQLLPLNGFVYACHNNTAKIEPGVFACWMQVLHAVPEAVLWLLEGPPGSASRLREAAAAAGIDTCRLVFAPRVAAPRYRGRLQLADLYLDTAVCSAHVTANDVLLAGVPLLTRCGDTWAGRIAASQVSAAGLPDLVCHTEDDYIAQAASLARDRAALGALRARLAARDAVLFDNAARVRDYERGLLAAWARYRAGQPCAALDIAAADQGPVPE